RGAEFALDEREAQWLAFTNADLEVPPNWLTLQLARADAGFEAAAGLVESHLSTDAGRAHHQRARGANLGIRTTGYRRSGGFAHWPCAEKRDILQRLDLRNGNICWDTQSIVARVRARPAIAALDCLPPQYNSA